MYCFIFFFTDSATTEIYTYLHTLSLHDALPISRPCPRAARRPARRTGLCRSDRWSPAQVDAPTPPCRPPSSGSQASVAGDECKIYSIFTFKAIYISFSGAFGRGFGRRARWLFFQAEDGIRDDQRLGQAHR